uniref:hypothetical protein n=1 Tax=Klebsiella pneumoniae TaxID=573 RepID=UPI0013D30464
IAAKMGLVDPAESLRIANERIAETLDARFPVYLLAGSRSDASSIWQLAEIVKQGNSPISSQPGHTVSLYLIGELIQHCVLIRLRTHSEAAL